MRNFFRKRYATAETTGDEGGIVAVLPREETVKAPVRSQHMPLINDDALVLKPVEAKSAAAPAATGIRQAANMFKSQARQASAPLPRSSFEAKEDNAVALPRFRMRVGNHYQSGSGLAKDLSPEISKALREAFTPTRPKQQVNSLFVGRLPTLRRIVSAIEEERAHVVLYGDRGRGKTSASNAVQQIASEAGYLTVKQTCSAELSFEELFRNFLRRVPSNYYQSSDNPFSSRRSFTTFDELLPQGSFSVTELHEVLDNIQGTHVLFILDEYDRVTNKDLRNKLAELVKNLTDASTAVTLLIVGVAEDVDDLLGKHPSIQRSLVAVHLPLMNDSEIERIILAGAESAKLTFDEDTRERIVMFSKGLPYYAQLLSLHAARSAIGRGSDTVRHEDLVYAVERCIEEAERSVVEAYSKALGSDKKGAFYDVLYAAAQCESDLYGTFHPSDMTKIPVRPDGESLPMLAMQYPLSRLTDTEKGAVLQKIVEPHGYHYQFRNQMMRQYILMKQAVERGLIQVDAV